MTLDQLKTSEPWTWPADSAGVLHDVITDAGRKADDRLTAVHLASDCVVMNDQLAGDLLAITGGESETEELRCAAAIALGPVLEESDTMGFDQLGSEPISQATFREIQRSLRDLHRSAEVPAELRRRALEAAVRAPEDWQEGAVRAAYASGDDAWKLTAVFCMQFIQGMDEQVLEALGSSDPALVREAVLAAGCSGLKAAWPTVKRILRDRDADTDLLLAAIEAVTTIRPAEAFDLLEPLMESRDDDVAAAATEAVSLAEILAGDAEALDEEVDDLDFGPLPDRRTMEPVLGRWVGKEPSAVTEAQQVMYAAFEETEPLRRLDLARHALEISPDCADAWVLIAEEGSRTCRAALENYAKGVAAGERALGPDLFEEAVGHFWGLLETRPYMRARLGLAQCLAEDGRVGEAIEHYRELLRLNPGDNQGVRWVLFDALLREGLDDEARQLHAQNEDDAHAGWPYGAVLLAFRKEGDGESARALLAQAIEANPHVPAYLNGSRRMPKGAPEDMSFGDASEAVAIVTAQRAAWLKTAGALPWLKERTGKKRRRRK